MENEDDLAGYLSDCVKLLDNNIDILSSIQYELDQQKEDQLIPSMQLNDLIDMTHEVSESTRIKKAQHNFIQRYIEK